MVELICCETRKARKPHKCFYCGGTINVGEKYVHNVCKYDDVYTVDEHEKCSFICSEIYDFCDPDEGMTEEDFRDGVESIRDTFVCPYCEHYDRENDPYSEECECNMFDKVYELLKKYRLVMVEKGQRFRGWKVQERKDGEQ